ncbi:hypothetical protein EUX98_g5663 [Antrodiella citrinella]|uniref:Uncharacterized protein n=1 Tax=Antrodiella citrinella TaxID=2447956 RepID=A0A4S4MRW8_9APHY|nr:hypothetical protein EUX98_g5663 [Antrodiella citrinella]
MVDERKAVPQTSAGLDLQAELEDEMNRHRKEMRELQQRMEELMMEKDNQHKEEIEELNEAVHEVRKQIRDVHAHSSKLNDERAAEKQKYEEEAQEMARVMQEREDRLRDLHEFSQTQKGMILELKEAMAEVQRKGEMQDHEKHMVEENFKVAQEAHKSGLETLRKEFEEKLAGVMPVPVRARRPRHGNQDSSPD